MTLMSTVGHQTRVDAQRRYVHSTYSTEVSSSAVDLFPKLSFTSLMTK